MPEAYRENEGHVDCISLLLVGQNGEVNEVGASALFDRHQGHLILSGSAVKGRKMEKVRWLWVLAKVQVTVLPALRLMVAGVSPLSQVALVNCQVPVTTSLTS